MLILTGLCVPQAWHFTEGTINGQEHMIRSADMSLSKAEGPCGGWSLKVTRVSEDFHLTPFLL